MGKARWFAPTRDFARTPSPSVRGRQRSGHRWGDTQHILQCRVKPLYENVQTSRKGWEDQATRQIFSPNSLAGDRESPRVIATFRKVTATYLGAGISRGVGNVSLVDKTLKTINLRFFLGNCDPIAGVANRRSCLSGMKKILQPTGTEYALTSRCSHVFYVRAKGCEYLVAVAIFSVSLKLH